MLVEPALTEIENQKLIRKAELDVDTETTLSGNAYVKKDVEIVNTSIYSNGLYEIKTVASEQSYNTNISLINNTPETKRVSLTYQLYYFIRNGMTEFTDGVEGVGGNRAEEYVQSNTWTKEEAFAENLSYGYAIANTNNTMLTSSIVTSVTVGPYSSVKLVDNYKISSDFQGVLSTVSGNITTAYDVWTYLVVNVAQDAGNKDLISTVSSPSTSSLAIETTVEGSNVSLSVKNNTSSIVTGFTISDFVIAELTQVIDNDDDYYSALTYRPSDWIASYWKYYKKVKISDGADLGSTHDDVYEYVQLTYDELAEQSQTNPDYFPSTPTYYEKIKEYYKSESDIITLTVDNTKFTKNGNTITNKSTLKLLPGESIVFATARTTQTNQVNVKGFVSASLTQANSMMIVNNGTEDAYLINNTTKDYYVRFTGSVDSSATNFVVGNYTNGGSTQTHTYYIGIVRAGQIIKVPMTSAGELNSVDMVEVSNEFNAGALTTAKWSPEIIQLLTKYFALVKTAA